MKMRGKTLAKKKSEKPKKTEKSDKPEKPEKKEKDKKKKIRHGEKKRLRRPPGESVE